MLKTDYGQEEAAVLFGADPRIFLVTAKEFLGDKEGRVSGVVVVDVEWKKDADGRFGPQEVAGSERTLPASLVLIAMGFLGPEEGLLKAFGVEADERGNAKAELRLLRDERARGLRRRRHAPGPEPRRLGHSRGPRRRARGGPLPHGRDPAAGIGKGGRSGRERLFHASIPGLIHAIIEVMGGERS